MNQKEQIQIHEVWEVVVRIDERQKSMKEDDLPEIKEHLKQLNNSVAKNTEHIAINDVTLYGKDGDPGLAQQVKEQNTRIWKLAVAIAAISATVGGGVAGLVQWLG